MDFRFIVELSQEILTEKNIPDAWILMQKNKQKSPKPTKQTNKTNDNGKN